MRVLIVKIGAIGDVVMAMPMISSLRNCHITWVVGKAAAPLLEGLVDELVIVNSVRDVFPVWRRLFGKKYDLIVLAHPDSRYRLFTLFVRGKVRQWKKESGIYHPKQYVKLVGGEEVVFPPVKAKMFDLGKPFIAVAPGGAKNELMESPHKRWPIERYAEFIRRSPVTVVVTGAESDAWVRDHLPKGRYVDLIGKLNLLEVVGVYRASQALITHDTGPLHLGKLAGCRVVGLFGPTNPAEFAGDIEVIWGGKDLPCRPCYDGKRFAPCSHFSCMKIPVEKLLLKVFGQ